MEGNKNNKSNTSSTTLTTIMLIVTVVLFVFYMGYVVGSITEFETKEVQIPTMNIRIENGVPDTTYIYKFY